jgi:C1A family cysteine protease
MRLIILTGLYLLLAALPVLAQVPQEAPLIPLVDRDLPPGRGFIPPPMDLSHLTGHNVPAKFNAIQAPTSWDWRTQSDVTSVKNQGSCGACYSFASLGNFEAKMLIDGAGTFDFSENNAKECHYQESSCGGGNYYEVASLFSQEGTVLESCDPYVAADVTCNSSCEYQKTLLDWRVICSASIPSTALLQDYIYNYGPVYTTLYAGDANEPAWSSEYNAYDGSYTMYHVTSQPVNHAVLIVGWDDNIVHAGGTGAWIVKNSWGTGWGGTCGYGTEGGYFTIAYGSANIGMWSSYLYDWQDYDPNGEVLFHDEGGWTGSYGYGSTTGWGLCKFVPTQDININRVEFWTNDVTTDIDLYLYDDFNGVATSNLLATKLNQSYSEAGYHSVVLDAPVEISSGNDVYAVVKFTDASITYPVVVDAGYTTTQTTYMSSSGAAGTWYDMGANAGVDIAIRLRGTYPLSQSVDDEGILRPFTFSLSENYPNPFNPKTTIKYSLKVRTSVSIVVYNLLGQEIRTLVDEVKPAGLYETNWDGTDADGNEMATGVYFYQIRADDFAETKKMLLLK